jgi:ankyrin repeat protein
MTEDHEFIQLVYKNEIIQIYNFLKRSNTLPFTYKDKKSYTALHVASLSGTYALFEFLITYTKRNTKSCLPQIQDWVNSRTDDGFTALHFASYRGSLVLTI